VKSVVAKPKKAKKMVLVHSCFDIELGDPLPSLCACRQWKTLHEAQGMVSRHEAEVVKGTEYRHICLLEGMARRTPRSATIDAKHIDRAYVQRDMEEKHRINEYGALNKKFLTDLIRYVPEAEFNRNKEKDWGIPILQFVEDNRTPGGINKETR
jgi:hypothetical protein